MCYYVSGCLSCCVQPSGLRSPRSPRWRTLVSSAKSKRLLKGKPDFPNDLAREGPANLLKSFKTEISDPHPPVMEDLVGLVIARRSPCNGNSTDLRGDRTYILHRRLHFFDQGHHCVASLKRESNESSQAIHEQLRESYQSYFTWAARLLTDRLGDAIDSLVRAHPPGLRKVLFCSTFEVIANNACLV